MKKKVCKKCKIFVEGEQCPCCKGNQFSTSWQGRISILDVGKSDLAKKLGLAINGEYTIKTR